MSAIYTFGEILIDAYPAPTSQGALTCTMHPGGAPANVAVQVAKLGGCAAFIGGISHDFLGQFLRQALTRHGVYASGPLDCPAPTAIAIVSVDAQGERSFSFLRHETADLAPTPEEMSALKFSAGDIVHACSNLMMHPRGLAATLSVLKNARRQGAMVSFDPNLRPLLWPGRQVDLAAIRTALALADLVKASRDEAVTLAGSEPEFVQYCLACGVKAVVLSDGAQPLSLHDGNGHLMQSTPKAVAKDTTGAGDALCGGLLFGIQSQGGHAGAALQHILRHRDACRPWLSLAAACGACTVEHIGAMSAFPDLASANARRIP